MLEVGCGYGNFRNNLPDDCEYWGIEPVLSIALHANKILSKVLIGTFQDTFAELPDHYFDCVVCNDVIEHMDDVDVFLQAIKAKIKHDGVIVGSIPNVRYIDNLFNLLVRKDWKYVDSGILDKTHLRFFTEKSSQRTFIANGYLIDEFYGINPVAIKKNDAIKRMIQSAGAIIVAWFIGTDTKYTQFGFRIKLK